MGWVILLERSAPLGQHLVLSGSSIMKGVTGHRDGRETFVLLGCPSSRHVQEQARAQGLPTVAMDIAGDVRTVAVLLLPLV